MTEEHQVNRFKQLIIFIFKSYLLFVTAAALTAEFYFLPDLLPFFAPAERPLTNRADFLGQIFLQYAFH